VSDETILSLYAVRNQEGKWLRRKGYGGYGEKWVEDIIGARMYTRARDAKAQITYHAQYLEDDAVPDLIELTVTKMAVLHQADRVKKALNQKKVREAVAVKNRAAAQLQHLQRQVKAQRTLIEGLKDELLKDQK
jgi:hypothetical protein